IHKNGIDVDVDLLNEKFKKDEIEKIFLELSKLINQSSSITISPGCCEYDNMRILNFDYLKPEHCNAIFEDVFKMPRLRALEIGKIKINNLQALSQLTLLTSLSLSNSRLFLKQNFPLNSLINLTSINLCGCKLVDNVAEQCFALSALKYLNFSFNP